MKNPAKRKVTDLMDRLTDGIIATDREGRVRYLNQAAAALLGVADTSPRGSSVLQLLPVPPGEGAGSTRGALERALRGETGEWTGEIDWPDPEGGSGRVRLRVLPRAGGRAIIALSRLSWPLGVGGGTAASAERIALLTAGMGHVLNNALQTIGGHADLIADHILPERERVSSARTIRRVTDRAADMVSRFVDEGRRIFHPEEVDAKSAIETILAALRPTLPGTIALEVYTPPETCPVQIDPRNLRRMLECLIANAVGAMPDGGTLKVNLRVVESPAPAGAQLLIEIIDEGHGMDARTRAHLFEPFYTTKAAVGSLGLGLAMVYEIVNQGSGTIEVESHPGRGTTFRVHYPLAREAPASQAREKSLAAAEPEPPGGRNEPGELRGHGESVLVVEDNEAVRTMVANQLESLGYKVTAAGSGVEAEGLHGPRPDVLLSDIQLPEYDGFEVAARFRKRYPELPVIYMSGYLSERTWERIAREAHSSYLPKPFRLSALAYRLHAALRQKVPAESTTAV